MWRFERDYKNCPVLKSNTETKNTNEKHQGGWRNQSRPDHVWQIWKTNWRPWPYADEFNHLVRFLVNFTFKASAHWWRRNQIGQSPPSSEITLNLKTSSTSEFYKSCQKRKRWIRAPYQRKMLHSILTQHNNPLPHLVMRRHQIIWIGLAMRLESSTKKGNLKFFPIFF